MKFLLIASVFALNLAQADDRLLGTWTSPCEAMEGGSYRSETTFNSDGTLWMRDWNYAASNCSGNPSLDLRLSPYQVLASTADMVTILIQPNMTEEGGVIAMTLEMTFVNPHQISARMTAAKVILNGQPMDMTPEMLAQVPAVMLTRR